MATVLTLGKLARMKRQVERLQREIAQDATFPGETIEHDRVRMGMRLLADHLGATALVLDLQRTLVAGTPNTAEELTAFAGRTHFTAGERQSILLTYAGRKLIDAADIQGMTDADIIRLTHHHGPYMPAAQPTP